MTAFNPFAGILAPAFEGKRCPTCHGMKPWDAFYRSAERADGHQRVCKACQDERVKRQRAQARARYDRNIEHKRAQARARYAANPEPKRARYAANAELYRARSLQRYYDKKAAA